VAGIRHSVSSMGFCDRIFRAFAGVRGRGAGLGSLIAPMNPDYKIAPKLGPEMARAYRNYLLTCRRLGVEPVPRERASDLMTEWFETLCRSMPAPRPTKS
jgi:hypothetical protein